ncbi:GntR family transcriptional regulator [Streptosporangium carneum]|uniref:GntR family transcriptional regulator n=1 Tax=Streptosporangium carneum TaxID=47481 RepID=A0A9W6HZ49_9ACTN|nr:GntR family transcriptional regulator [Streptosporangium carneum]GLK09032.1 GntR family transcriptional regulator [Streptosporangium carneum]
MTSLVRAPLRDQIRRVLLDGLVSGRWQPGERIVERRIAAELEVSQAPVREALRELESLRLIESTPNKGARVRAFTEADLREVYQVRAGLEETAAALALPSVDPEALAGHVTRLHEAARGGDTAGQVEHGVAFHREIVRSSGNRVLREVWESLGVEVWTHLSVRLFRVELHENAADHEPIVEAFRRRDPATPRMLRDHVLGHAAPLPPA